MTARQINQVLWSATGCVAVATACVVLAGVLLPVRPPTEPAGETRHTRAPGSTPAVASLPPLDSFEAVWTRSLRRPLTDVPTAVQPAARPSVAAAAGGGIPVSVAGTIGTSLALLRTADGSVVMKSVGEQLSGVDVLAIRPGEVDVRYAGRAVTLTKPRESASQSPTGNPNDQ